MKKGVNKGKSKGTTYDKYKNVKKGKRMEEEKKRKKRAENKRQNSIGRKARQERALAKEEASRVKLVGYKKGMILLEIDEEIVKRSPIYRRRLTPEQVVERVDDIEVKIFGQNVKLGEINNFEEIKEELIFILEGEL